MEQSKQAREKFYRAVEWARANVPELPAHHAAQSALMIQHQGHKVTAENVRARLTHPELCALPRNSGSAGAQ